MSFSGLCLEGLRVFVKSVVTVVTHDEDLNWKIVVIIRIKITVLWHSILYCLYVSNRCRHWRFGIGY
jgi:hypothetical protein